MSERFEMRVSAELLSRLDAARGDVPRAAFVKRHLERALAERPSIHIPGFGSVPDDEGGRAVARAAADAREVSESQFYAEGALAAVEEPESSTGCPECGGDMRERDPLSRIRVCADCGLTERP